MTLDEAIQHYYELSKNMHKCAEISVSDDAKHRLINIANQHKQLADWLKELKERRESDVKRGHWIGKTEYGGWGETYYQCSECETMEYAESNYCPNCGADLREIDNG